MKMGKLRFAIIGYGHIGQRHAAMIKAHPETELVALVDIADISTHIIKNGDNLPVFRSLDELWSSDLKIDILTVATPNGWHATHAMSALRAGKDVVIEKPMALKSADAQAVISLANQLGRHVFTVMQNRYSPPAQWLKTLVDSGVLGKILLVQLNCYWNRDERYYTPGSWHGTHDLDGGTLYTQFSHFIDMLYWLFGDIADIQTRLFNVRNKKLTDFEDSGFVNFNFEHNGSGTINFSTAAWDKNLESSLTLLAENGSVKIGGQYMDQLSHCHIKGYSPPELLPTPPANDYGTYTGSAQNHHLVVQNVVDVLKYHLPMTTTAQEGAKVVEIINRIYTVGRS